MQQEPGPAHRPASAPVENARPVSEATGAAPTGFVPVAAAQPMTVGAADHAAERAADALAAQVVARLFSSDGQARSPLRRAVSAGSSSTRSAAAGRAGGTVEPAVQSRIEALRDSGGQAMPPGVRAPFEQAFGADFSGVRLHRSPAANAVARDVGSHAFTVGSDIVLGQSGLDPSSPGDARLLAHELAHTLQDANGPVRRDIGMEFETRLMGTRTSTTGKPPLAGFADANAADTAWNAGDRIAKGKALLARPDMEVQADDDGNTGNSDLEVVIDHLPETAGGRNRLNAAMNGLQQVINRHTAVAQNHTSPAAALDGHGGFTSRMRKGMIRGNWAAATTAPQVTMGLRLQNVGDIVKDLHGVGAQNGALAETGLEKTDRDPGRLAMRRADPHNAAEPRALTVLDEAQTLVNAHGIAVQAVADYLVNVDNAAVHDNAMVGFLTIVFAYTESMARKQAFLKNHTPLMAKTDLAKMWTTLPNATRTYWEQVDNTGVSNLEKIVGQAPGYTAKLPQPLFHGVSGLVDDDQPLAAGDVQWYHTLTLVDWLRSIAIRPQPNKVQQLRDFVFGDKDRRKDKLTTKSFPGRPRGQEVEGFGALGSRTDTDLATGDALPVFELRSPSKPMTYAQAQQWALDMFDYIVSLNANPNGGHTRI